MNPIIAALVAGAFVWSASASGQAPKDQSGAGTAYQNPAAQATAEEKAKAAMKTTDQTKNDPKAVRPNVNDPNTMKAAQRLSTSSTDPAVAKANVEASKKQPRTKMPNIKDLTPEQREELRRQLMEASKP